MVKNSKKAPCIIFDMDGTLLDTIDFTLDAFEASLNALHLPILPRNLLHSFLGTDLIGMSKKLLRATTNSYNDDQVKRMSEEIIYQVQFLDKNPDSSHPIMPYPAITPILESLQKKNIALAVLSNSPHDLVYKQVIYWFPSTFDYVYGEQPDIPRKPSPKGILRIMREQGSTPQQTILVGDSHMDYKAALNAGIPAIMVDWGIMTRQEIMALGTPHIVSNHTSFLQIIELLLDDC